MKPSLDALAWPFRRDTLPGLAVGAVLLVVLPIAFNLVLDPTGMVGWIINLTVAGVYLLFLQSILHEAMAGKDSLPAWPEARAPLEFLEESVAILAPFIVAFLPHAVLRLAVGGISAAAHHSWGFLGIFLTAPIPLPLAGAPAWYLPVSWMLVALGWIYLPMAILVWTFYGGGSVANPVAVFREAARTGPAYLGLVAALLALVLAAWGIAALPASERLGPLAMLKPYGASFLALVIAARVLGTFYYRNRDRLGWERGAGTPT